jgi:hypothetical protein
MGLLALRPHAGLRGGRVAGSGLAAGAAWLFVFSFFVLHYFNLKHET